MNDAAILAAAVGLLCLAFALMAALADWWDERDQVDARRRNPQNQARPK